MAVWSEVALTELKHGRVDPEFYKPSYIEIERKLLNNENISLRNILRKIDVGHVGSMVQNYCQDGIILLQTQQVDQFFLNLNNCVKITSKFHEKLKKSQINKGDILIARSGSFGKASIYLDEDTINSADIIIIDIQESIITKGFLLSFLNSRFGSDQLIRFASGGVQGHVNLKILEDLIIPIIDQGKQNAISKLIEKSYAHKKRSQELYKQAQRSLEQELGLDKFNFKKPVGYEANFGEAMSAARIDAEYFQPKYVKLMRQLIKKTDSIGTTPYKIKELLRSPPKYGTSTKLKYINNGVPFLRIADLYDFKFEKQNLKYISSKDALQEKSAQVQAGDLLISRSGSLGLTVCLPSELDGSIFGSYFIRLQLNLKINPIYFSFYMNSLAGKMQVERYNTGGVQTNLTIPAIESFLVIPLRPKKEEQILALLDKSENYLKKSKQLLEQAKQMVEDLIEQAAGNHER